MKIAFPLIITNFKTYEHVTGEAAVTLAKVHEKVAKETGISIMCAVQPTDLHRVSSQVNIPILSQHFDPNLPGQTTGCLILEALKKAGAMGSLLNHAEKRIPLDAMVECLNRASALGLFTVLCARDHEEAKRLAILKPDCIAVEPPELIGGERSVSTAEPDVIKKSVEAIPNIPVLVGAGIKTGQDVKIAIKLGAKGILIASGVVKANEPERVLRELAEAMKQGNI